MYKMVILATHCKTHENLKSNITTLKTGNNLIFVTNP